jgi:hypothetical protein
MGQRRQGGSVLAMAHPPEEYHTVSRPVTVIAPGVQTDPAGCSRAAIVD